jgi:hypothetical protein
MEYQLSTAFSAEDLNRFYATGTNVIVAKPNAGGMPNVAWIVFRPFLGNVMTWEEQYGLYASNSDIVNGAFLTQMSKTDYPALDGKIYSLNAAGFFGPPTSGGTALSYTVANDYNNLPKGYLTFGLYQDAVVNGEARNGNAVSATPVLLNSTAVMRPFNTVYLWTQSQVKSNTVVTNVTSPMTEVRFGGTVSSVSLVYDATTGRFVAAANNALGPGVALEHHLPLL